MITSRFKTLILIVVFLSFIILNDGVLLTTPTFIAAGVFMFFLLEPFLIVLSCHLRKVGPFACSNPEYAYNCASYQFATYRPGRIRLLSSGSLSHVSSLTNFPRFDSAVPVRDRGNSTSKFIFGVTKFVGFICIIWLLYLVGLPIFTGSGIFLVLLGLFYCVIAFGLVIEEMVFRFSAKWRAKRVLQSTNAYLVYLRPFVTDTVESRIEMPRNMFFSSLSPSYRAEALIYLALRRKLSAIALGRAGEYPKFYMPHIYFENSDWQSAVRMLLREATLIVVLVQFSANLDWELRLIAQCEMMDRLLLVFYSGTSNPIANHEYQSIKEHLSALGLELPYYDGAPWAILRHNGKYWILDADYFGRDVAGFERAIGTISSSMKVIQGN